MHQQLPRVGSVVLSFDQATGAIGLALAGDLKSTTVPELQRDVFALLAHDRLRELEARAVVLDLRSAAMVDSLGLNLIIAILRWARERNLSLAIELARRGVYMTMLAVGLERQTELRFVDSPAGDRSGPAS